MERSALIDQIADILAGAAKHPLGVAGLMIMGEQKAGRRCVQPGDAAPFVFPAEDWCYPAVVSVADGEVRLIAILATPPGNGALRRLLANIRDAGLRPVICEPVGTIMPAILKRWRWKRRIVGDGMDRTEEWRPPPTSDPSGGATARQDGQDEGEG